MAVATPNYLAYAGQLWIAPIGSTVPTNTVVGSVFTDALDAAWLSMGATEDGVEFTYGSTIEAFTPAEFFDPVAQFTTERHGSLSAALTNWTASAYRRAVNGGVTAVTATSGTGATALYDVEPPDPGSEVRCMLLWESTDHTRRLLVRQAIQGGDITAAFRKPPTVATLPLTFNFEAPASGAKPFKLSFAGSTLQ